VKLELAQSTTGAASITSAGTTVIWGMNAAEWGILGVAVGIVATVITTLAYFYFKIREDRRKVEAHSILIDKAS